MIQLKSIPAFGYESERCNASVARTMQGKINVGNNDSKIAYWSANFFKVLGIFCPLVGAGRIIHALCNDDANKTMHVLRGIGELLGCGFFLLGADIAVTIYRASLNSGHGLVIV